MLPSPKDAPSYGARQAGVRNGMNIIFLTLLDFKSFDEHNIYCDLLREFSRHGHDVYCISPAERRTGVQTHLEEDGRLLKLRIGNTQKTNVVEKGISTMMIERQFVGAIRKYFSHVRFDLVLYSTPPITLADAIRYIKKRDGAKTYLLLKDIFPQNAVDLGLMTKCGPMGLVYRYFRAKEKRLYQLSDRIGCMSQANVDYLLRHEPYLPAERVEVCPNSIEVQQILLSEEQKLRMRQKYAIPTDKKVFVYGGNLGKPQAIPFIIQCLQAMKDDEEAFFLIVGDGTEYGKLEAYVNGERPRNVKLMKQLPKDDYDRMVAACDVGLIFLDHRFTTPNFPSRLLAYMQAGLPVLVCTDPCTDIGKIAVEGGFGWWCESNDVAGFQRLVRQACTAGDSMRQNEAVYLQEHYSVARAYRIIMEQAEG